MAQYGLGNFLYEIEVKDGAANFAFHDPEDASNTAEVSVKQSDFPEGISDPNSRQVADLAYSRVSKELNEARDERVRRKAASDLQDKQTEEARQRDEAAEFFDNSQELADTTQTGVPGKEKADKAAPAHTEPSQDSVADDSASTDDSSKKKK